MIASCRKTNGAGMTPATIVPVLSHPSTGKSVAIMVGIAAFCGFGARFAYRPSQVVFVSCDFNRNAKMASTKVVNKGNSVSLGKDFADFLGPSGISVGDGTIAGERNPQQCKTKSSINIS